MAVEIALTSKVNAEITVPESRNLNGNKFLRWNLLWFILLCLVLVPAPIWLYPTSCLAGFAFITSVTGWMCLVLLCSMIFASRTIIRLLVHRREIAKSILKPKISIIAQKSDISQIHIVLVAAYKEPIDVIIKTVDSLKAQTVAKQLCLVLAFEERTPEYKKKCSKLLGMYGSSFFYMMITCHPYGLEGEIPGKCSNANYASREAIKQLETLGIRNFDNSTFTSCDTDNIFPPDYCERLGFEFARCENRHETIWQPPLFYNYDLDKRPFFVRVTAIFRECFMLGILIPQSINVMSVFSKSVNLLIKTNYNHPSYQFDDGIEYLLRSVALGKRLQLKLLPCPVISGPTCGVDFLQEIVEWARQIRRWTSGAAEVFHYFCVKSGRFSFGSALSYGVTFAHYYGFVICSMPLICLTGLVSMNIFNTFGVCNPSQYLSWEILNYAPLMGLIFTYAMFAWGFFLEAVVARWLLNVQEDICLLRNVAHWLSTPFVLFGYSAVSFYALAEMAVRGKEVCKHGASKKEALTVRVDTPPEKA